MEHSKHDLSFTTFSAQVRYKMYKLGLTTSMMAKLFNIDVEYFEDLLAGEHRDQQAKKIILDLYRYFYS